MTVLRYNHAELDEDTAENLATGVTKLPYTVEARPPRDEDTPSKLQNLANGVLEYQTKYLGLKNTSPTIAYEIRRTTPGKLRFQYAAPTKRLERKIRTHLTNDTPHVELKEGVNGLPVNEEDTVGGGLLTAGRTDWYPLKTSFDQPPTDSVAAALHHHAMQNTHFVIQILFRPVIGQPLRRYYWRKRAYQRIGHLRREKEKLWGSRPPTPREKKQADAIENKAGSPRFHVSIRLLIINAAEYTPSRVKEISGAFNTYENPKTGQYLNATTVTPFRRSQILSFAQAVQRREFQGWSQKFQATKDELSALLSLPNRKQDNIQNAQP